jgi:hypothetical protein
VKKLLSAALLLSCLSIAASAQNVIRVGKAARHGGNYLPSRTEITTRAVDNQINNLQDIEGQLRSPNQPPEKKQLLLDTLATLGIRAQPPEGADSALFKNGLEPGSQRLLDSTRAAINRRIDTLEAYRQLKLDSLARDRADTLNTTSRVRINAAAGISNLDQFNAAVGNLSLGFLFRIGRYNKWKNSRVIDPHFLYAMWNTRTGSSEDTASLRRSFLFPDIHKRDFVLGYFWHLEVDDFGFEPTFEASLNRYRDSTGENMFHSQSFLVGAKLYWEYSIPLGETGVDAAFQLFPYYNLINVDPKDFKALKTLLNEEHAHPTWHSVGLQTQVQVDKVALFCNAKYILNKQGDVEGPDLQRFVYTIGTFLTF